MAAAHAIPAAGGGPPNPAHLPLFTVLSAYADALDALPLDLTRSFSDLRELDAVLGTHLGSLTARLHALAAALSDPDLTPAQRLLALKECAEEARAYKEGGEDKIRVAVNTAETIAFHADFIDRLSAGIFAASIPELQPALRPESGRFLHHSRIPYDAEQDRYMDDRVTAEDLPESYNDVDYAVAILKAQAAANGELTGSSKSNNALASRFNLNLQAGAAGSSFGMLGPSTGTYHGAGSASAAASTAQVLGAPSASSGGLLGNGSGSGEKNGSGSGSAGAGAHDRGSGSGSNAAHANAGSGGSSSKKSGSGGGGGGAGGSSSSSKRSAAAAGLLSAKPQPAPELRQGGSGGSQHAGSGAHPGSGSGDSHAHHGSSHRSGHGHSSSHAGSSHDRYSSTHSASASHSRSSQSQSVWAGGFNPQGSDAGQHHSSSRSHAGNHGSSAHGGSGSGSGAVGSALRENNKSSNSHSTGSGNSNSRSAAAAAAAAAAAVANTSAGDDQEDQTRYCYCQQVSYGEMIACDSRDCPFEWFHLTCANLTEAPPDGTKWYCEHCLEKRAKKKGKSGTRRAR